MAYHVLIKAGDAEREIREVLRTLGRTAEAAGVHKQMYVERANQTVVMAESSAAPIVVALRARGGWVEPEEPRD